MAELSEEEKLKQFNAQREKNMGKPMFFTTPAGKSEKQRQKATSGLTTGGVGGRQKKKATKIQDVMGDSLSKKKDDSEGQVIPPKPIKNEPDALLKDLDESLLKEYGNNLF
jgi:hypothetical protein